MYLLVGFYVLVLFLSVLLIPNGIMALYRFRIIIIIIIIIGQLSGPLLGAQKIVIDWLIDLPHMCHNSKSNILEVQHYLVVFRFT